MTHIIHFAFEVEGELCLDALSESVNEIIRRHEALRTSFIEQDGEPLQTVSEFKMQSMPLVDLEGLGSEAQQKEWVKLARAEAHRPFNLSTGPLFRFTAIKLRNRRHCLLFSTHHIISDAWSTGVFYKELAALYGQYSKGEQSPLAELGIQYGDYAVWQREWLQGERLERDLSYWRRQLEGFGTSIELPADRPRPAVRSEAGGRQRITLSREVSRGLKELSRTEGATLFMTMMSALNALLFRYSGDSDVVVGVPVAGRNRFEVEVLIGSFVDTLIFRNQVKPEMSIRDLLRSVKRVAEEAYAHQGVPLEKLVEELRPERAQGGAPMYRVLLQVQNAVASRLELAAVNVTGPVKIQTDTAPQFDLSLLVGDSDAGLNCLFAYNRDIFEHATVTRIATHWQRLLEGMLRDKTRRISELPIMTAVEEYQTLVEWNDSLAWYPQRSVYTEIFERTVKERSEAIAAVNGQENISYGELNTTANAMALLLMRNGVGAEAVVGLVGDRGIDFLIWVLGVFKAGGAYFPIDPHYPQERISLLLTITNVNLIVASTEYLHMMRAIVQEQKQELIPTVLDGQELLRQGGEERHIERRSDAEHLAYVISTSGSTGKPKSVMIENTGMVNHLYAKIAELGLTDEDSVAQTASQCFDISVWQFLCPLVVGARVQIFDEESSKDPRKLIEAVEAGRITVLEIVPSMLTMILDEEREGRGRKVDLGGVRWMIVTGEAVGPELVRRWMVKWPGAVVLNAYGPTECSDDVTHHRMNIDEEIGERTVPIGRPVANTELYVMGNNYEPMVIGAARELMVGGAGVGRGYMGRPDLTAERFQPDGLSGKAGSRLYQTGDRGRRLRDGRIEFLGRVDHQVKVRGFRIELGEIQAVLSQNETVNECVVIASEDEKGSTRVAAYVVMKSREEGALADLRSYLKSRLPAYMLPGAFVVLERMPLSPNGKIDVKALQALGINEIERAKDSGRPRTPVEQVLSTIWSELLRVDNVGVDENFFEIGGHSLLATQVISRIGQAFNVDIPLRRIFEFPTVTELARLIDERLGNAGTSLYPALTRGDRTGEAPLSFGQQRLWFLDQLSPGSSTYNMTKVLWMERNFSKEALSASLGEVVRRQESLRSRFPDAGGTPRQEVMGVESVGIKEVDLGGLEESERRGGLRDLLRQGSLRPFDLGEGPLFRATLVRAGERKCVLQMAMHHIIGDGWSMGILNREIKTLYKAYRQGQESALTELPIQYGDYAAWQRTVLTGTRLEEEIGYWRRHLEGAPPLLELPTDRPRLAIPVNRAGYHRMVIVRAVGEKVKEVSRREGVTEFMTLLAVFAVLLSRYSRQNQVVIGTPIAGRQRAEVEGVIGFFVNTLALRVETGKDSDFRELLKQVRTLCLEAYSHQDLPFEKLVEELEPERSTSHTPIFQVMFVFQNMPEEQLDLEVAKLRGLGAGGRTAKFDVTLGIREREGRLSCEIEYSADLFDETTIGRMAGHYINLLESALGGRDQAPNRLEMLAEGEREQILRRSGQGEEEIPDTPLHELFEQQATVRQDSVAADFEDCVLSYAELNRRANQLAWRLKGLGVGLESRVAICAERSLELVIGLVGILKAGSAYVPLDPKYPVDRLRYMMSEAKADVLVRQRRLSQITAEYEREAVELESLLEEERSSRDDDLNDTLSDNPSFRGEGDNLAYVIYTSGSTGKPKGAMNTHRAIVNRLCWMQREYGLKAGESVLQKTPISFDVSVWEFFWPLIAGGRLVLARPEGHRDSRYLLELIIEKSISTLHFVPSMLEMFLADTEVEQCVAMRRVICSGEALTGELMTKFYGRSLAKLHNLYGPTEAAVDVTSWDCVPGEVVSIGQPITNVRTYVLDDYTELAPMGVAGELHLGGAGLGRGYLDRPDLTAERFIPDGCGKSAGERLYRTGDHVRWTNRQNLEFLGRKDHQIKIRGYRIELGEIEAVLRERPEIREAVVLASEKAKGDTRLVAYVVFNEGARLTVGDLQAHIKGKLPVYMAPAAFLVIESLPLTQNGKIDRARLPELQAEGADAGENYVAPRTTIEEVICGLWCDLLKLERVGINESFFDIGGHSLLATQVVSRIREIFRVDISVRLVFEAPRLGEFASAVEMLRRGAAGPTTLQMTKADPSERGPLSYAQERLWFIDQLEPDSALYNMPTALLLTGPLNMLSLMQSLTEVARRHEVLRTSFVSREGQPYQVIAEPRPLAAAFIDLSNLGEDLWRRGHAKKLAGQEADRPFNLSTGPLLRVKVIRMSEREHILLITAHHIISDGWSTGILLNEFSGLYASYEHGAGSKLPELRIQYADFAAWQKNWLQGEVLNEQIEYWRSQLAGVAMLEMPTDYPRPAVASQRGTALGFSIPADLTAQLKEMSQRQGVTLFMSLLAAFQVLLSRYSNQRDIATGTPIANRNRLEIEGLIGFFVNTLVLRACVGEGLTFVDLLRQVRNIVLEAYEHQDVPFEKLVEKLQPRRDLSRPPLFQVMFALQNAPRNQLKLPELQIGPFGSGRRDYSEFELTIGIREGQSSLMGTIEYATTLFSEETIQRMLGHWQVLLASIASDPQKQISHLPLLGPDEELQLVRAFNSFADMRPAVACVHELFATQAGRVPDAIALADGDQQVSYRELDARSNQLAQFLVTLGVGPDVKVLICMSRCVDTIVAMFGVWKAGGAFLPVDPAYPQARLSLMLRDSRCKVIVTQLSHKSMLPPDDTQMVCIDSDWTVIGDGPRTAPRVDSGTGELAYIIYTSGSTGTPKGVEIGHHSLRSAIGGWEAAYCLSEDSVHLQMASFSFDVFIEDVVRSLIFGSRLVLCPRELLLIPEELYFLIKARQVDSAEFVPAVLRTLETYLEETGQDLSFMRLIVVGADVWYDHEFERLRRLTGKQTRLVNSYGVTECAIDCTSYSPNYFAEGVGARNGGGATIGRGNSGNRIYVLDQCLQLSPLGVIGELNIGGDAVARGYSGSADLTADKFLPDGLSARAGARVYRTGDLARWRSDGNLEFFGRKDRQVKVRGYRIELGEIEAVLGQVTGVREVAVIAREDRPGLTRLVAYFAADPGAAGSDIEIREYVRERLPEYMAPVSYVQVEALPLTPNGKIDRNALRAPELEDVPGGKAERQTLSEELLGEIWEQLLGHKHIGHSANFFEIGGHSLLATQVISRVREALGVEISVRELFETPILGELAAVIEERLVKGESVGAEALAAPLLSRVKPGTGFPLSFGQERLWFLEKLRPGTSTYNMPRVLRLAGALSVEALSASLTEIARRHESLRTSFPENGGSPRQEVSQSGRLKISEVDFRGVAADGQFEGLDQLVAREAQRPFNLAEGPLFRVTLLHVGEMDHVLIMVMHHIISDGWSMGIVNAELKGLYRKYMQGEASRLQEPRIQYADYAAWQREWISGPRIEEQLGYWRRQLAGAPPLLELPTDRPRTAAPTFSAGSYKTGLSVELSERVKELSRQQGVTVFMTMVAALAVMLSRYSAQDDIVIGTPIAGRQHRELEGIIGFFVNTLVLRVQLLGEHTFGEILKRVRAVSLGAYAHQELPFEKLVEDLDPQRSVTHTPIFQVMVVMQNTPEARLELDGLRLSPMRGGGISAKFDLTVNIGERDGRLACEIDYSRDLYDRESIQRMAEHYVNMLGSIVEEGIGKEARRLDMLGEAQRSEIVLRSEGRREQVPEKWLPELVEDQAERVTDSIAVDFEQSVLSYGALNRLGNQLAAKLRELGVGLEQRVAISAERSLELVIGLVGILKAGGAYVPLDPRNPIERLEYMAREANAGVLVRQRGLPGIEGVKEVELDSVLSDKCLWDENPGIRPDGDSLAYVIYTSGSTGKPKGAMNTHRAIANRIAWMQQEYGLDERDRVLQKTPIGFDVSVWEFFWPLTAGGRLVVARPEGHRDSHYLVELINEKRITTVHFVPSMLDAFLAEKEVGQCATIRRVICSGEALPCELMNKFYKKGMSSPTAELHNLYGPTEAAVDVTAWQCQEGSHRVSIGRPITNIFTYVLDELFELAPTAVPGELYIGGVGVGRGYLNRGELTAERFVPDGLGGGCGQRVYRTGDQVRWGSDANLEFLGRKDQQVKMRGYRIELGEIEGVLRECEDIREAVVVARKDGDADTRLVAYVVGDQGAEERLAEIQKYVKRKLPDYMRPSAYVWMQRMPLTGNGKIDRRALPDEPIATRPSQESYEGPRTQAEEAICRIWLELLKLDAIGIHDNFFDLGGHSLLGTRVISRMRDVFDVEIPLQVLFDSPTIAGLALAVVQTQAEQADEDLLREMLDDLDRLPDEEIAKILSGGGSETDQSPE